MSRAALCAFLLAIGCNDDKVHHLADAPPIPIDAPAVGSDAPQQATGREVTTGGGRMTSTSFVVDVQVGHGISQAPTTSASFHVEGNAPVKP